MSEARLHVTDSQGRRVVVLDRPLFMIGRRTSADLQVVSTDVSREHAEIVLEDGRYLLRDRASRYGTFVNGEQITERTLQHGDRIRLGRTEAIELVFMTESAKTTGFLDTGTSDGGDLRQMAAILNGLRALGSGRVLDEILALVMDSALDVTKAERGFMMLANLDGDVFSTLAEFGVGGDPHSPDAEGAFGMLTEVIGGDGFSYPAVRFRRRSAAADSDLAALVYVSTGDSDWATGPGAVTTVAVGPIDDTFEWVTVRSNSPASAVRQFFQVRFFR